MSTVIPLKLEYSDVSGIPYIPKNKTKPNKKFTIGVRWKGNPQFEHEQHRVFPSQLLFDNLKDLDCRFISLQRDLGVDEKPDWIESVPLDSWDDTKNAISSCDLVVTSCTSVAHLSGALGVPTCIIVPILSYYLWAIPGNTTPWYDSVTLFRQEVFGEWEKPMTDIKKHILDKYIQ